MKKAGLIFLAVIFIIMTSCDNQSKIIMKTVATDKVRLTIFEGGKFSINWGDGLVEDLTHNPFNPVFSHAYAKISSYTITVTGEKIGYFICSDNKLTSLNFKNNNSIKMVNCSNNQLNDAALNAFFNSLSNNAGKINISGNPGENKCNRSIAEKKGWIFGTD